MQDSDPLVKECINLCETKLEESNKKQEKKLQKQKDKNARIFKKIIKDKKTYTRKIKHKNPTL